MENRNDYAGNNSKFAATVHTTLPIRTASQGVSFALYRFLTSQTLIK